MNRGTEPSAIELASFAMLTASKIMTEFARCFSNGNNPQDQR
jgi:hypothetical protein